MGDNGRLVDHSGVLLVSMVTVVRGNEGLKVTVDAQQVICHELCVCVCVYGMQKSSQNIRCIRADMVGAHIEWYGSWQVHT